MNRRIARIVLLLAVAAAILLISGCTLSKSSGSLPPLKATSASAPLATIEMPTLVPTVAAPATATPQAPGAAAPPANPTAVPPTPRPQPTPVTTPVSTTPGKHVVQVGEWLFSIGRQYNVNPFTLAQVNGILPPYRIYPGQQLTIPGGGTVPPTVAPGTPCPSPYTVRAGETVYSIGRKCGKTPSAIITANNLVNPNFLMVGQKLQIP